MSFAHTHGLITISLQDGQELRLDPNSAWELAEQLRQYMLERAHDLDPPATFQVVRNGKSFKVAITSNLDFWRIVAEGSWEPQTFRVFDDLISSRSTYFDIGSWIGPTVLYAAQIARSAYCFEPDPIAWRELRVNLRLNAEEVWAKRIRAFNKAVSAVPGPMVIGSRTGGGDSETSALLVDGPTWTVETTQLQDLFGGMEAGSDVFIKMDIEGAEYGLIPSLSSLLASRDVTLLLSLHPSLLMTSLHKGKQSLWHRLLRRVAFVNQHWRLVRSLPFKHYYRTDGTEISVYRQLSKALVFGEFATELLATNRPWRRETRSAEVA